jgi:phosphatidylglycerophosphatase A
MSFEEDVQRLDLKSVVLGSILGAFGFLVALSWKDLIQSVLNVFIPQSKSLFYQFLTTVIITLIAVFVGFVLVRISKRSIIERFKRKNHYRPVHKVSVKPI